MDHRSWVWKRKLSEMSPSETESSGSASSHSERYSDDQEAFRTSLNDTLASHTQSPEVSSCTCDGEAHEVVKELTEKLSSALLDISAKEDLINQNSKVAEEAVSGWEQAETELVALKQQLQITAQKNFDLEDKISQLDEALKECVRQLCLSREEQEEKLHYSISNKTHQWELEKQAFEKQLLELETQLEAAKAEALTVDDGVQGRLEALEKENTTLKTKLLSQSEDLQVLLLERELSNVAAETASKHHLESIKKVNKLEAECLRLQSTNRRLSFISDHKPIATSFQVESLADSQSDSGERLLDMDNGSGFSDSWASALIADVGKFNCEKENSGIRSTCTSEIALLDDFLEMEKLVSFRETDCGNSYMEPEIGSDQVVTGDCLPNVSNEMVHRQLIELEEKVSILEHEKAILETTLVESGNKLEESFRHLKEAQDKIVELQTKIDLNKGSKETVTSQEVGLAEKSKVLETQLESACSKNQILQDKLSLLEESFEAERALCVDLQDRLVISESSRQELESQLESSHLELRHLSETVGLLEHQVKEERVFSSELAGKVEALEVARKASESHLENAHLDVRKLQDKAIFWELKALEVERKKLEIDLTSAPEFAKKVEAAEAAKKALQIQLESTNVEAENLRDEVSVLEQKYDNERALSADFAAKCHQLESDLSKVKRESDLQRSSSFSGDLKIKQEEIALAAEKLEACQKTIASLNRQLKSLSNLDDFLIATDEAELNGCLQDFHRNYFSEVVSSRNLPKSRERSSSPLHGHTRPLSHNRSISR